MQNDLLVRAAARRARVRLADGREGVIVYAPGTKRSRARDEEPRHGDREMCGVRFDPENRDNITPVSEDDITEIIL